MNILLQDKKVYQKLIQNSFLTIDLSNNKVLHFFFTSDFNGLPFKFNFIYKSDPKTTHVFTTLHTFVYDIMDGSSMTNYELLFSDTIKKNLPFLYDSRHWFRTYNIVRSYFGSAKGDLRQATTSDVSDERKLYSLKESYRKIKTGAAIMEGVYNGEKFECEPLNKIKSFGPNEEFFLDGVWNERFELNEMLHKLLDEGKIWRFFCPLRHKDLDKMIAKFHPSERDIWFDKQIVFDALENQ